MNSVATGARRSQTARIERLRKSVARFGMGLITFAAAVMSPSVHAVPSYAAQTGQSCVACHAGGQFPELTPYGRMFKLTGYTMGERSNPLSAMVVADFTSTKNNADTGAGQPTKLDVQTIADVASLFIAGKVTDNIGGFAQITHTFHDSQDANNNWQGATVADNMDLRYADRKVENGRDLVWGVSLHNNPTVQDVWNSAPAWGAPYYGPSQAFSGLPTSTLVEGTLAQQVAGIGAYVYLNQHYYAELTSYQNAVGGLSFLHYGNNAPTTLDGSSLYWRLAYTREWNAHNMMVGAFGMDAKVFPNDATGVPITGSGSTHYRDVGFDAQYQYLLSPHTVTAQFRAVQENIDDNQLIPAYAGPATLNTMMAKASYVYREKYGASLTYKTVSGSADAGVYADNATNKPDSEVWTPELFWMPRQNMRLGVQFNMFTKFNGSSTAYDAPLAATTPSTPRDASDNNNTYVYFWMAF